MTNSFKYITILAILASAIVLIVIGIFQVRIFKINGTSMAPTLETDKYVISYKPRKYMRHDIIAFRHQDVTMIKRIVGLPGDEIDIKTDGTITINGKELQEPGIVKYKGDVEIPLPHKIMAGHYFVLGDNRKDSIDSRNIKIGTIREDMIVGKIPRN